MNDIATARLKAYGIIMVLVVILLMFAPGCASTDLNHIMP